jgi:hypothetical protein
MFTVHTIGHAMENVPVNGFLYENYFFTHFDVTIFNFTSNQYKDKTITE